MSLPITKMETGMSKLKFGEESHMYIGTGVNMDLSVLTIFPVVLLRNLPNNV